jgi:transketolase
LEPLWAKPRKSVRGRQTGDSLRSSPGHHRFNKAKALYHSWGESSQLDRPPVFPRTIPVKSSRFLHDWLVSELSRQGASADLLPVRSPLVPFTAMHSTTLTPSGPTAACRALAVRAGARRRLLKMHFDAGVGHLGGNLSVLDTLLVLHHDVLGADDRFVLSKGHAAGALYVTLWSAGRLADEELATFHKDNTRLSGHPPASGLPEVAFATGSLGHGFGLACGMALALKLSGRPGRVFCVTSDGEWNEGSTWEALHFAAHHRLDNLTTIVDMNGLQGFGSTEEVCDLGPLRDRIPARQVDVDEVDGHDLTALQQSLGRLSTGLPRVVLARTHKGHGLSFAQDRMEWHYLPLSAEQYARAIAEVDAIVELEAP